MPSRPIESLARSAVLSYRHRRLCRVRSLGGRWVHTYGRWSVIPEFHRRVIPQEWITSARATLFHNIEPHSGETVIDVGAGVGSELFAFAEAIGPTGRIVAIEASPSTYQALVALGVVNDLGCVGFANVAVTDRTGEVTTICGEAGDISARIGDGETGDLVITQTLDALGERLAIDEVGFLKVNIEGGEVRALRGARELLEKTRSIAVSCHDFLADREDDESYRTEAEVRALLGDAGFSLQPPRRHQLPWIRNYVYGER